MAGDYKTLRRQIDGKPTTEGHEGFHEGWRSKPLTATQSLPWEKTKIQNGEKGRGQKTKSPEVMLTCVSSASSSL